MFVKSVHGHGLKDISENRLHIGGHFSQAILIIHSHHADNSHKIKHVVLS